MVWNDGLRRPIKVIAPEGTVCNVSRPTPTSCATVCAIEAVNNVACHAINKMLLASEKYSKTACANWQGNLHALFLFGKNDKGHDLVGLMTESLAGAMGARPHSDGVDIGGHLPNPVCRISNVELTESMLPIRYLFRRRLCDSAGAGKYRGGTGLEYAIVAHAAPYGLDYVSTSKGVEFRVRRVAIQVRRTAILGSRAMAVTATASSRRASRNWESNPYRQCGGPIRCETTTFYMFD
jgi:N-methylhydantoinase B